MIQCLQNERDAALSSATSAKAHAALMAMENGQLKGGMNRKKDPGRVPLNANARMLTGEVGKSMYITQKAARDEVMQVAEDKRVKKLAGDQERLRDRHENATTRVLKGPVNKTRRKGDLEEIAYSLSLVDGIDPAKASELRAPATIPILITLINTFLSLHPALESNSRFADLYPGSRAKRRSARIDSVSASGKRRTGTTAPTHPAVSSNNDVPAPLPLRRSVWYRENTKQTDVGELLRQLTELVKWTDRWPNQ